MNTFKVLTALEAWTKEHNEFFEEQREITYTLLARPWRNRPEATGEVLDRLIDLHEKLAEAFGEPEPLYKVKK